MAETTATRLILPVIPLSDAVLLPGTVATLTIDTEIRFASAADRAAFTNELTTAVNALAAKFHDEHAERGRWHRLVVAAHPIPRTATHRHEESDHG